VTVLPPQNLLNSLRVPAWAVLTLSLPVGVTAMQCIDYGKFIQGIGSLDLYGENNTLAVSGDYAYVGQEYSPDRLIVVDISEPKKPRQIATLNLPQAPRGMAISGHYAYLAAGTAGLQVIDISDPAAPVLVGDLLLESQALDVAVSGNRAYVANNLVGLTFVDITDPASPVFIETTSMPSTTDEVAIDATYAYLSCRSTGLHIVDLSTGKEVGAVDTPGNDAWAVAISGHHAFVGDDDGLQVIDVSNPMAPQIVAALETDWPVRGVMASGTTAFLVGGNLGLLAVDISIPEEPRGIGRAFAASSRDVVVQGALAFVAGYNLDVIDVENPASPPIIGHLDTPLNGYLAVAGQYAFLTVRELGLQVIDVADPEAPLVVHAVDTPGYASGVTTAGPWVYVADGESGLQVLDASDPTNAVIVGNADTPGFANQLAFSGNLICVADREAGLQLIDVSDPSNPFLIGGVAVPGNVGDDVAVQGNVAYVVGSTYGIEGGMHVIDITHPNSPALIASFDIPGYSKRVQVVGDHAFVATHFSGLWIIDVSDPTNPQFASNVPYPGFQTSAPDIFVSGSFAYTASFCVINISNRLLPQKIWDGWLFFARSIVVQDGLVYTADGNEFAILPAQCELATSADESHVFAPRLSVFPNPGSRDFMIRFSNSAAGPLTVRIYDVAGRLVRTLHDGVRESGPLDVHWYGEDDHGRRLAAGAYLIRATTKSGISSGRVTLIR